MSFKANEETIDDLLPRKIYIIPRNQRRYVWNKTNWSELLNDILYREKKPDYSHFIGSIVLKRDKKRNGIATFIVIDGQQRIMTISIILVSIMYLMKKYNAIDEFEGTKDFVITRDENNRKQIILDAENARSYENVIEKLLEATPENLKNESLSAFLEGTISENDKNIGNAFNFFISRIDEYANHVKSKLDFLRKAVRDIEYINITATSEEDSYTIFEILNARGIDLEDHELLKNYIMRYIEPEDTRDKAKEKWMAIERALGNTNLKKFVRHYTIHRYGSQRDKKKADSLSDYKIIQENNKGNDTRKLLEDIVKKSEYYLMLCSPSKDKENGNCSNIEYEVFNFFKRKRQEQMRPLLLSLIMNHKSERLSNQLYNRTLQFLYDFYVCYNIISKENSNKLTGIINKYSEELTKNCSDELIENLTSDLRKRLPSRDQFIEKFITVGWSHNSGPYMDQRDKEKVQIILETFEKFKTHGSCPDNLTIEHVLPDSQERENCQIGNLLPLEEWLNSKCKDEPVENKMKYYQESAFKTTRDFTKRYSQNKFEPNTRAKKMAEEFYDHILKLNH